MPQSRPEEQLACELSEREMSQRRNRPRCGSSTSGSKVHPAPYHTLQSGARCRESQSWSSASLKRRLQLNLPILRHILSTLVRMHKSCCRNLLRDSERHFGEHLFWWGDVWSRLCTCDDIRATEHCFACWRGTGTLYFASPDHSSIHFKVEESSRWLTSR